MTFNACPPEFVNHLHANRANRGPDSGSVSVLMDGSDPAPYRGSGRQERPR